MIYRIYYQGVVKFITPVKNREELMELRNSKENLELLAKARTGDQKAKGRLLQLAYNLGRTEGKLAGCESIGSYFFHRADDAREESGRRLASGVPKRAWNDHSGESGEGG